MPQGIPHDEQDDIVCRIKKLPVFLQSLDKHRGNATAELLVTRIESEERAEVLLV